jgi:hypothetical protein
VASYVITHSSGAPDTCNAVILLPGCPQIVYLAYMVDFFSILMSTPQVMSPISSSWTAGSYVSTSTKEHYSFSSLSLLSPTPPFHPLPPSIPPCPITPLPLLPLPLPLPRSF